MLRLAREDLDYVPQYCEENVWRLLARPELERRAPWAGLVSNAARRVPTLRQRAGRGAEGRVEWDYHALALVAGERHGILVLDLDTTLPFPCPLGPYLAGSFPEGAPPELAPLFRLIGGAEYLARLASDRSHMRRGDGSWIAPPPPWPAPGQGRPVTLMDWIAGAPGSPGELLDAAALARRRGPADGIPRRG